MLQDILTVTRAVLQPAEDLDELGMQPVHAHFEHRLFAGFLDGRVDLAAHLVRDFLYAGGMYPAVRDELFERQPRHLAADGIETRKCDDIGGIVDDEIHACRGFERADIPAHAPDYPALHLVARKGDDADGVLRRMIGGAALYGGDDDILRLARGVLARFRLDGFRLGGGAFLDIFEKGVFELLLRLFLGHARDSLELASQDLLGLVELLFDALQAFAAVLDRLLSFLELRGLTIESVLFLSEGVLALVERVLFLQKTIVRPLPFRAFFLGLAFEFRTKSVLLLFCLEKAVLADGFRFKPRLFEDTLRLSFCQADFVIGIRSIPEQSGNRTRRKRGDDAEDYPNNLTGIE